MSLDQHHSWNLDLSVANSVLPTYSNLKKKLFAIDKGDLGQVLQTSQACTLG